MSFQKDLSNMKKDEKRAPKEYQKLYNEAETPHQRKVIRHIMEQEKTHYPKLNKMERKIIRVKKRNSVRARCLFCGNSLSVVNGHYYCHSCRSFTVQARLNDRPIINKI